MQYPLSHSSSSAAGVTFIPAGEQTRYDRWVAKSQTSFFRCCGTTIIMSFLMILILGMATTVNQTLTSLEDSTITSLSNFQTSIINSLDASSSTIDQLPILNPFEFLTWGNIYDLEACPSSLRCSQTWNVYRVAGQNMYWVLASAASSVSPKRLCIWGVIRANLAFASIDATAVKRAACPTDPSMINNDVALSRKPAYVNLDGFLNPPQRACDLEQICVALQGKRVWRTANFLLAVLPSGVLCQVELGGQYRSAYFGDEGVFSTDTAGDEWIVNLPCFYNFSMANSPSQLQKKSMDWAQWQTPVTNLTVPLVTAGNWMSLCGPMDVCVQLKTSSLFLLSDHLVVGQSEDTNYWCHWGYYPGGPPDSLGQLVSCPIDLKDYPENYHSILSVDRCSSRLISNGVIEMFPAPSDSGPDSSSNWDVFVRTENTDYCFVASGTPGPQWGTQMTVDAIRAGLPTVPLPGTPFPSFKITTPHSTLSSCTQDEICSGIARNGVIRVTDSNKVTRLIISNPTEVSICEWSFTDPLPTVLTASLIPSRCPSMSGSELVPHTPYVPATEGELEFCDHVACIDTLAYDQFLKVIFIPAQSCIIGSMIANSFDIGIVSSYEAL